MHDKFINLQIYRVGGCVRDQLLGYHPQDNDYVVVGATAEMLQSRGFKKVGADFPCFLHPDTCEEYALARTERKTGQGYKGFQWYTGADTTLEDDLKRRDLTINAMAMDQNGHLIDPYYGRYDLDNKQLRHVSPAFEEDPLRVLRVARFKARFYPLGFTIAPETMQLMQTMAQKGELKTLTPERVWLETQKALSESKPSIYFQTLRQISALKMVLPEIDDLFGIPQKSYHHPEVDTGIHTMMVVDQAAKLSQSLDVRFAALVHDLGKAYTPQNQWPEHKGHETKGVSIVDQLTTRLKLSKSISKLAKSVTRYHGQCHKLNQLNARTMVNLINHLNGFKNPSFLYKFTLACEADSKGRQGYENTAYPQKTTLLKAREVACNIDPKPFINQGLKGNEIGQAIQQQRAQCIAQALNWPY